MIRQLINKLYLRSDIPEIKYETLAKGNPFERVLGAEGIHFERIPIVTCEELTLYRTEMEDGAEFKEHYHDCKEIVHIKQGVAHFRGVDYMQGDRFVVQAYVPHSVIAKGETILYVEFVKPKT